MILSAHLLTKSCTDCGMTHFHNKDVRKAIVEHNPASKELVESLEFGEIAEG